MKKLIAILVFGLFATAAFAQKDVPGEGRAAPAAKSLLRRRLRQKLTRRSRRKRLPEES